MSKCLDPFRFLLISLAGWMNQRRLIAIEYLREENRVLWEHLGGKRLRLNDDQRRRLVKGMRAILYSGHTRFYWPTPTPLYGKR
jgi:hypothetical protein